MRKLTEQNPPSLFHIKLYQGQSKYKYSAKSPPKLLQQYPKKKKKFLESPKINMQKSRNED